MANSAKWLPTVEGTAKAWSNLDGVGTIAAADDFNVASYTDSGTGNYGVTVANDFASGNYAINGTAQNNSSSSGSRNIEVNEDTVPTTGAYNFYSSFVNATTNNTRVDVAAAYTSCFGDLA